MVEVDIVEEGSKLYAKAYYKENTERRITVPLMTENKKELLDKIKTHFSSQERMHFYVPEWDQDIYMTPLSIRQQEKISSRAKDSPMQLAVYGLILKAEDKDGEKLFGLDDKVTLLNNVSFKTVEKIISALLISGDTDESEKN